MYLRTLFCAEVPQIFERLAMVRNERLTVKVGHWGVNEGVTEAITVQSSTGVASPARYRELHWGSRLIDLHN